MKRISKSIKSLFLMTALLIIIAAALYFILSRHNSKIPERALFVSLAI